ncbi:GntR family transcriptional regulator [Aeromicrobium sp. CF3.5]|uniref:GntR family transcriptional regulator n=1 Tax=Aeromicrobium sp. CF3.5 TaxID=3373078 RepID=UPI003EE6683D
MIEPVRVDADSDTPLYRQIVRQVAFLIEGGDLVANDRLPSVRLLAANLDVNRNTVARAYADLRDRGLVVSRGRAGTVVASSAQRRARPAQTSTAPQEPALRALDDAVQECLRRGVSPDLLRTTVADAVRGSGLPRLTVAFVECNEEEAKRHGADLAARLDLTVLPLVIGSFDPSDVSTDLVVTTFFHLAEVQTGRWRAGTPIVATVVGPHVKTLVAIAAAPKDQTIGICYSSEEQAASISTALARSGIENTQVVHDPEVADLRDVSLVVIPSGRPDLASTLRHRVEVVEFGNVLDDASVAMVAEVVQDLSRRRRF